MCITDSNVFIEINEYSHKMEEYVSQVLEKRPCQKNQDLHKVPGNLTMVLGGLYAISTISTSTFAQSSRCA